MIPLKKVFMIDLDEPITRSVIEKIMKRCYSNILVYDKERTNIVGKKKKKIFFVGIFLTKIKKKKIILIYFFLIRYY
jgi:CBS domain containing-hemolysin-like protein